MFKDFAKGKSRKTKRSWRKLEPCPSPNASQVDREGKRTPSDFGKSSSNSSYQKGQEFLGSQVVGFGECWQSGANTTRFHDFVEQSLLCLRLFFEDHGPNKLPRDTIFVHQNNTMSFCHQKPKEQATAGVECFPQSKMIESE